MNIDLTFGKNREIIKRAMNYVLLINMMKLNKEIKILNVTEENKQAVVHLSVNGELFDFKEENSLPHLSKVIMEKQR